MCLKSSAVLVTLSGLALFTTSASAQDACAKETAELQRLANQVTINVKVPSALRAGGSFELSWNSPQRFRPPVYVVLAVESDIRVVAKELAPTPLGNESHRRPYLPGTIVLPSEARAPLGLSFGAAQSRVLVPLYQPGSKLQGSTEVRVFNSGTVSLRAAVIAHTPCGEQILTNAIDRSITILSGTPKIVLQDPYDIDSPKVTIVSNSGRYLVHVFEGRYRVYDKRTGAKLVDRAGHNPNLSPSERFVVANIGVGSGFRFDVVDLVSLEVVASPFGPVIGWTHNDAFMIDGSDEYAALAVHPMLLSRSTVGKDDGLAFWHPGSCHFCPSWSDASFSFDIDNGIIAFNGGFGAGYDRVYELATGHGFVVDSRAPSNSTVDAAFTAVLSRSYEVVPIKLSDGWHAREPILFSHAPEWAEAAWLRAQLFFHQGSTLQKAPSTQPSKSVSERIVRGDWREGSRRNVDSPRSPLQYRERLRNELLNFGIATATSDVVEQYSHPILWGNFAPKEQPQAARDSLAASRKAFVARIKRKLSDDFPETRQLDALTDKGRETFAANVEAVQLPGLVLTEGQYPYFIESAWRWQVGDRVLWLLHFLREEGESSTAVSGRLVLVEKESAAIRTIDLEQVFRGILGTNNMSVSSALLHRGKLQSKLYFDRYLLIASAEWGTIAMYDLKSQKAVTFVKNITQSDLLADADLSASAGHIIQTNSDGQLFLHEVATSRSAVAGRYVDEELILFTSEGYYWSSYEGSHFVQLRFPGRAGVYSVGQFAPLLNRPDLVKEQLAGGKSTGFLPTVSAPPILEVQFVDVGTHGPPVRLRASVQSETELAKLRLYLDGQPLKDIELSGTDEHREIILPPGTHARWMTLLALDKLGIASLPHAARLEPTAGHSNRLHAVLVGVNTYPDPELKLAYARSDAQRLAAAFRANQGRYYGSHNVVELLDEHATISAITKALEKAVAIASPDDTIVFSFAGHGLQGSDGRYYITPAGFRLDNTSTTGLPWAKVASLLQTAKARVIVILDACHSGLSGVDGLATNDAAASALLSGARSPMLVLAASKGRQLAEEARKWGGGVFTYALVEALQRNRSTYDLNHDGTIEISELYKALRSIVGTETEGRQTPWLVRQDLIGDFTLF